MVHLAKKKILKGDKISKQEFSLQFSKRLNFESNLVLKNESMMPKSEDLMSLLKTKG